MTDTETETPTWETSDTPPPSNPPAKEDPTPTPTSQPQQEPDWLKTLALNCCSLHFQFHFHDPEQAINQRRVVVQAEGLSIAVEVAEVSEINQAIERAAATAVGAKGWEPVMREKQIFADQAEVEEFSAKIGQFGEDLQSEVIDLHLQPAVFCFSRRRLWSKLAWKLEGLRVENERLNKENRDLITALETDIAQGTQEKLDAHEAPEPPAPEANPEPDPTPAAEKPKSKGAPAPRKPPNPLRA